MRELHSEQKLVNTVHRSASDEGKRRVNKKFFLGICYRTDGRLVDGCPVFARFSGEMLIRRGVPGRSGTGPVHVRWCVQDPETFPLTPSWDIIRLFSLTVKINEWTFIPEILRTGSTRRRYNFYSFYSRKLILPITIYNINQDTILYVIFTLPSPISG